MFRLPWGSSSRYCDGLSRRNFVQIGLSGLTALSLPQLLQLRASANPALNQGSIGKKTACILIWLDGGPSHMDLYDMKPEAPREYRGIWNPISTNVPGIEVSELFPLQAQIADKFSVIRSLYHNNGDHFTAAHLALTGRAGVNGAATAGKSPFVGSLAIAQCGSRVPGLPPYVAVPYGMSVGLRPGYFGANYAGIQYNPLETVNDANAAKFQVQNLDLPSGLTVDRLEHRMDLMKHLDRLRSDLDARGTIAAMHEFDHQAMELVTGAAARQAFDIGKEDPKLRDKYGRDSFGQSVLLARRLVEAGSTLATVHFGGWDHHWDLQKGMERYLPMIDRTLTALFTDLEQRGLYDNVLVMMLGEFSRTPRMNDGGNGGAPMSMGTPGRDHWGNSMFCLVGGGGVKGGRIVGSTTANGESPKDRPVSVADLHHTLFHVLGADPHAIFPDHSGRPTPALEPGSVIQELF